jgi:hypothetical protein
MRLPLALCLFSAAACRSSLPHPSEAELAREVRSVVHEPGFTLYSPYDSAASAAFADSLRAELRLVRALIPDASTSALRLYLAPLEGQGDLQAWETPSNHSLKGAATEGEYAFVYVPAGLASSSALERATLMRGGTLRHELTHLCANRAGIAGAPWFNEGLALEVESMRESGGVLHAHPFPPHLQFARTTAKPGALAELLHWSYADSLNESERSLRYVWAQALFRFLAEQQPGQDFFERARGVHGLAEAALREREPAWLEWLGKLDALERIRAGADSSSDEERAVCVGAMPSLAESRVPELLTRAADEFALEKLGDPGCSDAAATFLLFFRSDALRADDLERLEQSNVPARVLTAQALHARRKEPFELELARAVWSRVPESERGGLSVIATLIPGLLAPDGHP